MKISVTGLMMTNKVFILVMIKLNEFFLQFFFLNMRCKEVNIQRSKFLRMPGNTAIQPYLAKCAQLCSKIIPKNKRENAKSEG